MCRDRDRTLQGSSVPGIFLFLQLVPAVAGIAGAGAAAQLSFSSELGLFQVEQPLGL